VSIVETRGGFRQDDPRPSPASPPPKPSDSTTSAKPPRKVLVLLPLLISLIVAGCGGVSSHPSPGVTQPAAPLLRAVPTLGVAESARTPEGAPNPSPAKPLAPPVSLPRVTLAEKHIDGTGLHLLEGFEGFVSCPYQDVTGVWTIGFGEAYISPSTPCESRATAQAKLKRLVEDNYEWALRALDVSFDQNEWNGLVSFTYNLGAGIFQGTTVGADLRARRFYAATRVMLQYDHAGGVVLPGLRTRREVEVRVFLTPEPKPKPPTKAQLHAQLERDYTTRRELRALITRHACRTHTHRRPCPTWFHQGASVNNAIRALHARGIW
jgi:lysozyme